MRLLQLTVQNVRGLPDLTFNLDGKNVAIWGPNGAGKSCVVDAIDFLFTGRISRLMGEGTGALTLARHGPHIDHDAQSALVSATVQLAGFPEPVELSRCMAQPDHLVCPDNARALVADTSDLMNRGGVVLTRRDILRFVVAEGGKRADEIEALLRLKDVDDVRSSLIRARTELGRKEKSAQDAIETARAEVNVTLGLDKYSDEGLLDQVNASRQVLGGGTLESNTPGLFKDGLAPPPAPETGPSSVNPVLFRRAVQNVKQRTDLSLVPPQAGKDRNLRESITKLKQNPELLAELEHLELTEHAGRFVDDSTTACPVCGASWPEGYLRNHLETRIATAQEARRVRKEVSENSEALAIPLRDVIANVTALSEGLGAAELDTVGGDRSVLGGWLVGLKALQEVLNDPIEHYLRSEFTTEVVAKLLVPENLNDLLGRIEKAVQEAVPKTSPEQTAWDKLTRLEESVRALGNRVQEREIATLNFQRSKVFVEEYEKARDSLLGGLYSRIADRFVEFYCVLHDHESEHFSASLRPQRASLTFEVDFMGRGTHPPHALHSEGHQDSMGICLFLALNEELVNGQLGLVVLDDVMMSVDTGHRKDVCRLIAEQFADCQFVITTHDRTWAKQLKQEGVVAPSQVIEFTGWTLEGGPNTHRQLDLWETIQSHLEQDDVSGAAFRLRRGSEDFFEDVCSALGAQVTYNSGMQWQLDDWLPAAMDQYKDLVTRGRRSALSWGDSETVAAFDERESIRKQIYGRTHAEQWSINTSVHYNNWEDMSKEDFSPVADAFRDLQGLFVCSTCGGLMEKMPRKGSLQVAKCPCGNVNWNLRQKPTTS